MDKDIIPIGPIEERIYVLRGKRVMLDAGLPGTDPNYLRRVENSAGIPKRHAARRIRIIRSLRGIRPVNLGDKRRIVPFQKSEDTILGRDE